MGGYTIYHVVTITPPFEQSGPHCRGWSIINVYFNIPGIICNTIIYLINIYTSATDTTHRGSTQLN
jgi:hypothetical protein